mmetsp:Transcript_19999/g.65153  ORF Transcript_19999/g.65153 Transcript_19999/m.65153 type:complete len:215 (-) Transcript_19999:2696-3340(-)
MAEVCGRTELPSGAARSPPPPTAAAAPTAPNGAAPTASGPGVAPGLEPDKRLIVKAERRSAGVSSCWDKLPLETRCWSPVPLRTVPSSPTLPASDIASGSRAKEPLPRLGELGELVNVLNRRSDIEPSVPVLNVREMVLRVGGGERFEETPPVVDPAALLPNEPRELPAPKERRERPFSGMRCPSSKVRRLAQATEATHGAGSMAKPTIVCARI